MLKVIRNSLYFGRGIIPVKLIYTFAKDNKLYGSRKTFMYMCVGHISRYDLIKGI